MLMDIIFKGFLLMLSPEELRMFADSHNAEVYIEDGKLIFEGKGESNEECTKKRYSEVDAGVIISMFCIALICVMLLLFEG